MHAGNATLPHAHEKVASLSLCPQDSIYSSVIFSHLGHKTHNDSACSPTSQSNTGLAETCLTCVVARLAKTHSAGLHPVGLVLTGFVVPGV